MNSTWSSSPFSPFLVPASTAGDSPLLKASRPTVPASLDAFSNGESPAVEAGTRNGENGDDDHVEFTGVVVQEGDPVVLDDGEETISVATGEDLELGEEVTIRGRREESRVYADEVAGSRR